jgi:hypothetical protein
MARFLVLLACAVGLAAAMEYQHHDKVPILVNNVGPFHNPAESYAYYSLPFCAPKHHADIPTMRKEI